MTKRGPAYRDFDWNILDGLLGIQCTRLEICEVLKVSEDTLSRHIKRKFKMNYAAYSAQKGAGGRISLRRKQFEVAKTGNVSMLIWLGKQYLGQSDKAESSVSVNGPQVIVTLPHNNRDQDPSKKNRTDE